MVNNKCARCEDAVSYKIYCGSVGRQEKSGGHMMNLWSVLCKLIIKSLVMLKYLNRWCWSCELSKDEDDSRNPLGEKSLE
jgi:hypothetical protein